MLWYVIQTYTGKEEQLVKMICRQVPQNCYGECFVAYYEQLRDRRQENQIHILRLFPGYIFISTDKVDRLFQCLKMIPSMTKIMASGAFAFTPLFEGEAEFLLEMMDADRVVRLTYAATDGKNHVSYLSGPLEKCRDRIQKYRFRDRYANVSLRIAGQEKIVRMGIILNDDIRREMTYGKVEAQIDVPGKYMNPAACEQKVPLNEGDRVAVIDGPFEGNTAIVRQVRGDTVSIRVHMFEREIPVDLAAEAVRRLERGA